MIDITKIRYRAVLMDENGIQFNINDYICDLGWEENEKELATRISFSTRNEDTTEGFLSSIAKLGCLFGIFASDGAVDEEVARGYITDWMPDVTSAGSILKCKCYDQLYALQKSQDNIYFPSGTGTKDAICKVFEDWEIPLGDYTGPNESHSKLAYKSQSLADVILDILDDAQKKGAERCIVQSRRGRVNVIPYASNSLVYCFREDNMEKVSHKLSTAEMITRVKVIGEEDDEGRSSVEATVDGETRFGIRQKIYARGKDESTGDAQIAAEEIIEEKGKVQEDITIQAPDVPFIRKGDVVHLVGGALDGYYYVKGIQHDASSAEMTAELIEPYVVTVRIQEEAATTQKSYNVGDIVNFHGGTHFVSSYDGAAGYSASPGPAEITIANDNAHPYHLIHTDGSSNVYGWVDNGTFD